MPYTIFEFQKNHSDSRILTVQDWLEKHYQENISVKQLATLAGMSFRTFYRRFKAATGDTPLIYLQRLRIETAKRALETTLQSVEEVSYAVGYENSSFFRKLFKQYSGLSPKEYQIKFRKA